MRKSYLGFLFLLMFGSLLVPVSAPAYVDIGVSITVAPPVIPVYTQPICPGPNYIWTPGYWRGVTTVITGCLAHGWWLQR